MDNNNRGSGYYVGDSVRIWSRTTSDAGAYTVPDAITISVADPTGAVTTYSYPGGAITSHTVIDEYGTSLTEFYVTITATLAGRWLYRIHCTGSDQSARESAFIVRSTSF